MSEIIKNMLASGRQLLTDTKQRKPKSEPIKAEKVGNNPTKIDETDPYRAFSSRVINDKPKKNEVIEMIKGFIEKEEAKL
jgi:hypothetical protein